MIALRSQIPRGRRELHRSRNLVDDDCARGGGTAPEPLAVIA
jgi:hypothetical protein